MQARWDIILKEENLYEKLMEEGIKIYEKLQKLVVIRK